MQNRVKKDADGIMRQFVSSSMPDRNGRIVLSAKEHRYLSRVLRLEDGSYIDVRLPGGSLIKMKLHTGKTECLLETEPLSETGDGHKTKPCRRGKLFNTGKLAAKDGSIYRQ